MSATSPVYAAAAFSRETSSAAGARAASRWGGLALVNCAVTAYAPAGMSTPSVSVATPFVKGDRPTGLPPTKYRTEPAGG